MNALAGQLILRPGAAAGMARAGIASSRQPLAGHLLRGKPAAQAPVLLAGLYALCGQSHRYTAQLAVDAARGLRTQAAPHERAGLALETMREHVRRIWLDWPRLLGGDDDAPASLAALRSCPLFRDEHAPQPSSLQHWVERCVLGEPLADWLRHWQDDPAACLARWSAGGATLPARLLRAAAPDAAQLLEAGRPLLAHAGQASLAELGAVIGADAGFEQRPLWRGRCCETGSWNRLAAAASYTGQADSAWCRLGARVAELAALSGGAAPLALGAMRLGPGEALAWSEMARGLLLHRVSLGHGGDAALVADYRVVAPTEWNFHPQGAVAAMLARMPEARDAGQRASQARSIGVLAAAFDPCVTYQIEFDHA